MPRSLTRQLRAIDGRVESALEQLHLPAYLIDREGIVRWLNPAAIELTGDVTGGPFVRVLPHDETRKAREIFMRKLLGATTATDFTVDVVDRSGRTVTLEVSSASVRSDGRIVGVFGIARSVTRRRSAAARRTLHLTERQHDVLMLLAHGQTTQQIALDLHISDQTVRNHIRALMRALGAHTRLQAVINAQQAGLLEPFDS